MSRCTSGLKLNSVWLLKKNNNKKKNLPQCSIEKNMAGKRELVIECGTFLSELSITVGLEQWRRRWRWRRRPACQLQMGYKMSSVSQSGLWDLCPPSRGGDRVGVVAFGPAARIDPGQVESVTWNYRAEAAHAIYSGFLWLWTFTAVATVQTRQKNKSNFFTFKVKLGVFLFFLTKDWFISVCLLFNSSNLY